MLAKTLLVMAAMLLTACVSEPRMTGYRFDAAALKELQPGKSTKQDVAQVLGSPSSMTNFEVDRWHYVFQQAEQKGVLDSKLKKMQVVTLEFSGDGTLQKIEEKDKASARDVAIAEQETPTEGRDFSIMRQLVGNLGRFNSGDVDAATGQ